MKAALNGVPSLSVLDGWWLEGHVEGVTGWAIGDEPTPRATTSQDAAHLRDQLEENDRPPLLRRRPRPSPGACAAAIALNGSFFNTERMVRQYEVHAYRPGLRPPPAG